MAWEPDYITSAEYKSFHGIPSGDTQDDTIIGWAITTSSRMVDKHCSSVRNGLGFRRQFGLDTAAVNRYYTPRWDIDQSRWVIEIDDLMVGGAILHVDLDRDDVYESAITAFTLRPQDAVTDGRPYTQISVLPTSSIQPSYWRSSARVFAQFGWSAVPTLVKNATALQAGRLVKRRKALFGITGSPQKGTEQKVLEALDVDVASMLESNDFVRLGWTV